MRGNVFLIAFSRTSNGSLPLQFLILNLASFYYHANANATPCLAVAFLSVRPSVKRVHCNKTK